MMTLAETAKIIRKVNPPEKDPRAIADMLAKIMVMIAVDVAAMNQTGRTPKDIEQDARTVMYSALDGNRIG